MKTNLVIGYDVVIGYNKITNDVDEPNCTCNLQAGKYFIVVTDNSGVSV